MFNHFPIYHMQITLEDFNAQLGKDYVLIPKVGKETLHDSSNDNRIRVVNFATSKNLAAKSTMFLHQNIHKYGIIHSPSGISDLCGTVAVMVTSKGSMSTEGETLQVSVLPYRCSICPPLVTRQMSIL